MALVLTNAIFICFKGVVIVDLNFFCKRLPDQAERNLLPIPSTSECAGN
jgi:hypothetical protein